MWREVTYFAIRRWVRDALETFGLSVSGHAGRGVLFETSSLFSTLQRSDKPQRSVDHNIPLPI
jgi:hypothetical protein